MSPSSGLVSSDMTEPLPTAPLWSYWIIKLLKINIFKLITITTIEQTGDTFSTLVVLSCHRTIKAVRMYQDIFTCCSNLITTEFLSPHKTVVNHEQSQSQDDVPSTPQHSSNHSREQEGCKH